MSKGPYKPGPLPQWYAEALAEDYRQFMRQQARNMQPYLAVNNVTPNVTIMGVTYNGNTGKKINV